MAVKKSVKKAPSGGEGSHPHAALGGTLEDYFNSKKSYQSDEMKELNKEVTKHLLTGSGANNAMIMEKNEPQESVPAKDRGAEPEEKKDDEDDHDHDHHDGDSDSGGDEDDYEDDYESDSSAKADKSVAGMTLGDYLKAKGDGVLPAEGTEAKKHVAPPAAVEKLPQKPTASTSKKALPPAVISGMSLDYYLGASAAAAGDNDALAVADGKSPPKNKKKQSKGKSKPGFLAALPARQAPHDSKTYQDDDFATPYQKRMTKKTKLKQQQQQHIVQGGSAAKSILLGDSHSSSQLLLAKHLPGSSSSSASQPKDKKKLHHQGSGLNPPLPKLLGSSPSAHGFLPPGSKAHSDTEDGDSTGDDHDSAADEKLPPLQHQQHTANK